MINLEHVKKIKELIMGDGNKMDELEKLIDHDAVINSPANFKREKGSIGLYNVFSYWKNAFTYSCSEWLSTKTIDDTVVIEWKADAQHTGGDFFGIIANDRSITYSGTTIYKFANEKLIEYTADIDIDEIKAKLTHNPTLGQ